MRNLASGLMVSSATVSHRERPHGVERGPPRRGGRPARGVGRGAGRLAEREFPRLVAVRCHDPRQRGLEDERTRGDGGLARGAPVRLAPLPAARPRPTLGRSALLLSGLGLPRGDDASLAQRAGLSVPGIYHYYPSKHEMLVAILDLTMDDLIRRSSAARDQGVGPVERFTLLVECLALYHTPSPRAGVRRGERDTQPSSPAARAGGRHPARAAAHGRRRGSGRGSKRRLPHRTPPRSGSGGCHDAHRAPAVVLRGGTDQRRGCRAPVCGVRPGPGPLPALPEWAACRRTKQLVSMGPLSTRPAR